mgnify:CR=1 FL=1
MIEKNVYLVVDVGGTFLKSAIMDENGNVQQESVFTVPSYSGGSKAEIMSSLRVCISTGLTFAAKTNARMKGIGFSFPGPFDYKNGISLMKHKFHGLYQLNIRDLIRNISCIDKNIPICFIHDANAVLIGEQWMGNAQNYSNSAVVTLGTGIGFAHSQDKVIQCNSLGGPSASVYSISYKDSILEDYVSQRGILKIYRGLNRKNIDTDISVYDIANQAYEGDITSVRTFHIMGDILAQSLSDILQKKKIECLLFGGQISKSYHLFEQSLREGLDDIESLQWISSVKSIENAAFYGILVNIIGGYGIKN